jgi:hypothetical protein
MNITTINLTWSLQNIFFMKKFKTFSKVNYTKFSETCLKHSGMSNSGGRHFEHLLWMVSTVLLYLTKIIKKANSVCYWYQLPIGVS